MHGCLIRAITFEQFALDPNELDSDYFFILIKYWHLTLRGYREETDTVVKPATTI